MASQLAQSLRTFLALPEEQRVLGQYRLLGQLGSGGFAPVWLASERYGSKELRKVAIKLFAIEDSEGGPRNQSREEMIIEEAQALCNVEHPNVVRFYTFTKDATNRVLGLVMEYVRGVSLDRRLEDQRLPYGDVVDVGIAIASALETVHRVGLVHRDLKPANVIVSEGVYKLIDFGIASADRPQKQGPRSDRKVVLDDLPLEVAATKASMLAGEGLIGALGAGGANPFEGAAGTLGYMDPRCVSTQTRASPASDFYALGATLFECAAGTLPATFAAKASGGFGLKGEVLDGRVPSPSLAVAAPDAPPELVAIVDRLLDADPEKRPASAVDIVAALSACRKPAAGTTTAVTPTPDRVASSPPADGARPNTAETAFGSADVQPRPSRGWMGPVVGLAALAIVGGGTVAMVTRGGPPAQSPVPVTAPAAIVAAPAPSAALAPFPSSISIGRAPRRQRVRQAAPQAGAKPVPSAPAKAGGHAPVKPTSPAASAVSAPAPAPAAPVVTSAPGGVVEKAPY